MHSTPNPKQTDPRDFPLIAPEDKELSNLAHDAMRYSSAQTRMGSDFSAGSPIPPVDLRFRRAAVNNVEIPGDRPSIGRRAVRAFIRFLWVACLGGAGVAWRFYGDEAKQIIVKSAPPFALILSPPLENPKLPEQPTPPAVQASATKAAPPQPARLAQTATEGVAPTAALSPESARSHQSIARDLANTGQEIEQLKANIEQLKASQEQNVPRCCQGFRAEPAAQGISVSAPVGRRAAAQADAISPFARRSGLGAAIFVESRDRQESLNQFRDQGPRRKP